MFLLMICGFVLSKLGFFDEKTTGKLSAILTKFIIPASIVASFVRKFNTKEATSFFSAFGIDMLFFILSALIASFIFRKKQSGIHRDLRMCTIFVNNGFFALPLISALFGDFGIFIGSAHLSCMHVFLWTYGTFLYKGKEGINIKSALLSPGLIATALGSVVFISSGLLPQTTLNFLSTNGFTSALGNSIYEVLNMLKGVNTPLAMLVAGAWLEKAGIKKSVSDFSVWKATFVRMIVIPLLLLSVIYFIPISHDIKTIIMLGSCAPTAIIAATFSQLNDADYVFCTKVITVTTLISAITMPLFVILLSFI
jgi:predicted permease